MKKKILSIILAVSVITSVIAGVSTGLVSADAATFDATCAYENFETMTDAQAKSFFKGSKDDTVTVDAAITDKGEGGSKGLSLNMNIPYGWAWLNYGSQALNIDKNVVGVRIWYTLNQDTNMRFQLRDFTMGAWTNIAFEGSKESKGLAKAGTYSKTVYFKDTEYTPDHQYSLAVEAAATADGLPASVLTIDNIAFVYEEVYEDFESMTDSQASGYLTGNKDGTVTTSSAITSDGENGSKALAFSMNIPYGWAWLNYTSKPLKIDKEIIGIKIWYTLNQDTNMRFQLKDYTMGAWTDIAFEGSKGSKGLAKAGTYSKTIYFKDTEYTPDNQYCLGIEAFATADGLPASVLTIDNISFLRYGSSSKGDITALTTQINAVKNVYTNDESKYTAASWKIFADAYKKAISITADASQREMDVAKDVLKSAFDSLEPLSVDKSDLKAELDAVKVILDDANTSEKYTAKSLENLKNAYKTSKGIYDKAEVLQSEINETLKALVSAKDALKKIPSANELVYGKVNDKTIMDFEHYEDTLDMADLQYSTTHPWQLDMGLKNTLETAKPISGEKSMKIAWDKLGDDFWGAERYYMFNGYLENQALYFDLVTLNDWNAAFAIYDEAAGVLYQYEKKIKGSTKVQHILLPFNEFKNDGVPMSASEWDTFRNGAIILKIEVNKVLGGLPDNSFLLIDNMMLVSADGPKTSPVLNYTEYDNGGNKPDPKPDVDPEPDVDPNPGDVDVNIEAGSGFNELKKFDTPVNSLTLTAEEAIKLDGNGIYAFVKSAEDCDMKINITDGTISLDYLVSVKASSEPVKLTVDYTDFVKAYGTYHELNKANTSVRITFDGTADLYSIGTYDYATMYIAEHGNDIIPDPDNPDKPINPESPETGDFRSMMSVLSLAILVIAAGYFVIKTYSKLKIK